MKKQAKFYLLFKGFDGKVKYSKCTTSTGIKKDIIKLRKFGFTRSLRKKDVKKGQYYYNKEGE